jgi:glycosyltransferase involved in cell wall biosynthesis
VKISLLLESFQPEYWGGRETRWKNLVNGLSAKTDLTIFADFTRVKHEVAFPGVSATFVNIGPLPPMYAPNGNRSLKHAILFTFRGLNLIRYKTDVILTDQTPLISIPILRLVSIWSHSQLFVTWHEVWSFQTWLKYSKFLGLFGLFLQTIAIAASRNIIVPSTQVSQDFKKRLIPRKTQVITNGVRIFPEVESAINRNAGDSVSLLYVGRLIKHKHPEFLIEIMRDARELSLPWNLTIVGNGTELGSLKVSVENFGLTKNVNFKNNISESELHLEYRNSDVFVFPSEREGYGISVAEAISNSLPILLYDVDENAATHLLEDNVRGVKLKYLNTEDWIAAVQQLIINRRDDSKNQVLLSEFGRP